MRNEMTGSALAPALLPTTLNPTLRAVLLVVVGTGLLTLSAKINVLTVPVPITMQTFAVMAIAAAYGSRLAVATVVAYLLEGFVGIPVFANTALAGPGYFLGTTAGFLIGFIPLAFIVGWAADRGWDRNPVRLAAVMIVADAVVFALGFAWLAWFATLASGATGGIGMANAWTYGLQPFIVADLVKIALAACLVSAGWVLLQRRGRIG